VLGNNDEHLYVKWSCHLTVTLVGLNVKKTSKKGRIQLNCGPASSATTLNTSCPEYLVCYLLARFIHVLQGAVLLRFYFLI